MKVFNIFNYKEFLTKAAEKESAIKRFRYIDGRLLSFETANNKYKFDFKSNVLTPSKFAKELGFANYTGFLFKRFDRLSDFANEDDAQLWYNGYFGGLVGLNTEIVNDYISNGQVVDVWDYDINQAYLYQLTQYLPTKVNAVMTFDDFNKKLEIEKVPFIYFFEIVFDDKDNQNLSKTAKEKLQMFDVIGKIRGRYSCFDFLNSKQGRHMIVSEKRLSLINQIYFKTYKVGRVWEFERRKFSIYEKILYEYLRQKDSRDKSFKSDALRLYGTLGQIFKRKEKKMRFETTGAMKGNLLVEYETFLNNNARPQVAMWVADSVAEKLFDIITTNYDKILSWNTDGVTALGKLPLQISRQSGKWKLNHFMALPFLLQSNASRLLYMNVATKAVSGGNNITTRGGKVYEHVTYRYSNLQKGYVERRRTFRVNLLMQFDQKNTFRNICQREHFIHAIARDYQEF